MNNDSGMSAPRARLPEHEPREHDDTCGEQPDRRGRAPASGLGGGEPESERCEPGDAEHTTGHVDASFASGVGGQREKQTDTGDDGDGNVDEQRPPPAPRIGEDAAEEHADPGTCAHDRPEDAERPDPVLSVGEGQRQQSQRRRGDEGTEQSLHRAGGDQHLTREGKASHDGGEGEPCQSDQQGAAPADHVRDAPTEEQHRTEGEHVDGEDPLTLHIGQSEVGLGRGHSDVHDRAVDDHHQLRGRHPSQRPPACGRCATPRHRLVRHPRRPFVGRTNVG